MKAAAFALACLCAGPAAALCDMDGAGAAGLASGDWTVMVIESIISVGNINHIADPTPPQTAQIEMDAEGAGRFAMAGAEMPLARRAPGTFHIEVHPERRAGFDAVLAHLERTEGDLPCPLAALPQYLGEKTAEQGARRALALTDLVQLDAETMAGVQYTVIRDPDAPLVTVRTTLTLTRETGE
ncbi:hypothetical protein [Pseudaestuariivita atlantica]|uniref:Uncharacterized protein n=1 Tax=Pseudaestuariivita atlantica TaxID=1317121 RepID=A0A0L1JMJ1_9RHOB|nr:hypothetical protein [Pseudaestuariivita atlantica]KNG92969.1 hypothetical protein ATO11_13635 [Pseudaestuariivita atlantica]